ncbi:hypothetical protein Ddye_006381 [Dipteronia dyeriana]|uniref:Uncharacterized protein n=1 Tax=Dipteronia dyeriana TaxID=168575 RepID=A0AAE0CR46_9ROSI|nr:hypothetical protein Ddye_006381 [Dipteronia dyeriana]
MRNFFWNDGTIKRKVQVVDWDTICKSKKLRGLGVGRMKDKGLSLLVKWLWRFSREHSALWKKVICLSSGKKVRFWNDIKWDSVSLKMAFLRINALAKNKEGMVRQFGRFENSSWKWEVNLRRELFDWEINQWNRFLLSLDSVNIRENFQDAIAWSINTNEVFSVKSFRYCLENTGVWIRNQGGSPVCVRGLLLMRLSCCSLWMAPLKAVSVLRIIHSRRSLDAKFIGREANSLADCLAKAGADMMGDRLEWSVF